MSLTELAREARRIEREHGFGEDVRFAEDLALVHSELSEALEDFRDGRRPNETWYSDANGTRYFPPPSSHPVSGPYKPCGIPSELADVIIRVLAISVRHGIDIERAVTEKMSYNDTRPYKHGRTM